MGNTSYSFNSNDCMIAALEKLGFPCGLTENIAQPKAQRRAAQGLQGLFLEEVLSYPFKLKKAK